MKQIPPIFAKSSAHDQFHILPVGIRQHEQKFALVFQFLKHASQLRLRLDKLRWVREELWEVFAPRFSRGDLVKEV